MKKLVITNGDSAANLLREAGMNAEMLPWRDVLHIGPVPQTESLEALSTIRADFLKYENDETHAQFEQRDAMLQAHTDYDQIELWFEHDLYDQLQLVQVIDALNEIGRTDKVYIIQAPTYLGMETPETILRHEQLRAPLDAHMINAARTVWAAFRRDSPKEFAETMSKDLRALPFLGHAVERMLQELPGPDGLTRSERQIVYSINRGVKRIGMLFARCAAMEEAVFWGDTGFFKLLSNLSVEVESDAGLLSGLSEPYDINIMADGERRKAFITSELNLTDLGQDVLGGRADYADRRKVDWWWGGTHLTPANLWRWDWEKQELLCPPAVH